MLHLDKDHVKRDGELTFACDTQEDDQCTIYRWTIHNADTQVFHGTLRLRVDLPTGLANPWFMIPGFLYGENRRKDQKASKRYPRFDAAVSTPRHEEMESSWWDFPADRTAAPLVYVHDGERCFTVASDPHYTLDGQGQSDDPEPQVGVGFGFDGTAGYIRMTLPACEEPFTYTTLPLEPATIRRLRLEPGDRLSGCLRIYDFAGVRHDYQRVLEHEYEIVSPRYPIAPLPEIEPLVADATRGVIQGHYHEAGNYFIYSRPYDPVVEQIANSRGITMEWHQMNVGFVNGFVMTHGLLEAAAITGNDEARDVAIRVADRICMEGVSPSGLFWADFMPETVETPNGSFPNPLFREGRREWGSGWLAENSWVHSRTIADACDHLAAMIRHDQEHHPDNPSLKLWKRALLGNLQTALDLQLENGSYGQYYNAETRQVVKEDGCGGLLWIPAMIKACEIGLGDQDLEGRLRESVVRAGDGYASYVEAEYIWGAPEDNDSPTSEDGMNAALAYCELYRFTQEERFLRLAQLAADWMLTFRMIYNEILPPDSLMGRYDMRSRGSDYASTSNNHPHVFEVLVTRHLCDLTRWTGNSYYRDRARDHWAFVCQHLSRCHGMYNGFRGAMAEQFYWCNYGSWSNWQPPAYHYNKGNMASFTAVWCIGMILLGAPQAATEFADAFAIEDNPPDLRSGPRPD